MAAFYANERMTFILGDEGFLERMLGGVPDTAEVPTNQRRRLWAPEEMIQAVTAEFGVDPTLRSGR